MVLAHLNHDQVMKGGSAQPPDPLTENGIRRIHVKQHDSPTVVAPSVLAIVGSQAPPGVGLGVPVTSPPAEKHSKSRFPDVPGGPARRPREVRDVTC